MMRACSTIHIATVILAVAATLAGCRSRTPEPTFTQEEVANMQALLRSREWTPGTVTLIKIEAGRTASQNYRLVLPVFAPDERGVPGKTGGPTIVGSQTIGKLPVTEVRRLASLRKLEYDENSNAQAIIFQNAEQGGAPGGGGQGGCESDHSTPAHGQDIAARIEDILRNINQSKYIFLY
jgi:hypothetical protein